MSVINKVENRIDKVAYDVFIMNYLISIIEGMRDKNLITEEMFINARCKILKKYSNFNDDKG